MDDGDLLADFRRAAEEYVALIDGVADCETLLIELASLLPILYSIATKLPDVPPDGDDEPARESRFEDWQHIRGRLDGLFGDGDLYWAIDPSATADQEPAARSLSDDLAGIYLDVNDGLSLLTAGGPEIDAIWEWRFSFWSHWGAHAADAIRVIHARVGGGHGE
jgi:Domain of unknown function (DUF5063)